MKKIEKRTGKRLAKNTLRCMSVLFVSLWWIVSAWAQEMPSEYKDVEPPPVFHIQECVPPGVETGPDYWIDWVVHNNGINNLYDITTIHGTLQVESTPLLNIRLRELAAVREMEKIKRTSTYADGVKKAATGPLRLAKGMVTQPVATTRGVVGGVSSRVRNVGHALFGKRSEQEDSRLKTIIGFSDVKRKFAYKLGVDPYSDYQPLQDRLNELAWAGYAGGMTIAAAFMQIPGTAGTAVSVSGVSKKMDELIRDNAPAELKKLNAKKLKAMGVPKGTAKIFLNHRKYAPSIRTYLVGALEQMDGVEHRWAFIEVASLAENKNEASNFQRQAELMAGYHKNVEPVARLMELGGVPALVTKEKDMVLVFPCDHIAWTEGLAAQADGDAARAMREVVFKPTTTSLWFEGTVSKMARKKLEERGWEVNAQTAKKLALK